MRIVKRVLLGILVLLVLAAAGIALYLRLTLPKTSGVVLTRAVRQPVQIRRNAWGVPFISAGSQEDLFVAIGFVHAQDRLFQMDLSRRMAAGRLAEVFGRRVLDMDIAQRQQANEEAIRLTVERIPAEIKILAEGYCRGVNLFIATQRLPPEFRILGYRPEKWQPRDLLAMFQNMESILIDSGDELTHLKLRKILGQEAADKLFAGDHGAAIINAGETMTHSLRNPALQEAWLREAEHRESQVGSNNWVVAGSRTDTGRPYLANDPHLANRFPSYFYQVHGRAPGLELCGNTLPGIPFIIIGRNAEIGWGFTNIGTDVIDYFQLSINPQNQGQYLFNGKWEDFGKIRSTIRIRGGGTHVLVSELSAFGPVRREGGIVLAEHSITRYPTTAIEAVYGMNMARNIDEFLAALKKFSSPAQNVVFADCGGNIGYFPTGRIPRRARGDGSLPLFGESSADLWQGFVGEDEKPYLLNPQRGFIATANNQVLPEGAALIFCRNTYPAFRADRIEALLGAKEKLALEDMRRIQTDTQVISAAYLLPKIRSLKFAAPEAAFVHREMLKWDCRAESGLGPYLFYTFERRLALNTIADHLPDDESRSQISTHWLYKILGYPQAEPKSKEDFAFWVDDIQSARREEFADMVEKSLVETYDAYQKRTRDGKESAWEKLHAVTYAHPLGSVAVFKPFFNRGPYFMPGGRDCVMVASGYSVGHMSALRMVLDFSDFSRSLLVNSSGQSGHFLSPHYDDQIRLYTAGRYRPMEAPPDAQARPLILQPVLK